METNQKIIVNEGITNKEALKDKIHEIHNYLRNNGAGYGMNALKVFNVLYGLKKIEEANLIDKIGLKRPECEFSYLLKMANKRNDEHVADMIYGPVLDSIHEKLRDLLFYEIPKNLRDCVFVHLLKEINEITKIEESCNVLLSGKIYEYFIGRDESAISELGAYFTDRHIVDYIYNKLDIQIYDDNTIDTMIDMFGGSGGFTTGYINFLSKKYPEINWENELKKVYHYDMNNDVIKSAGLEFFCLTGVTPNMDKNIGYKNSFTDEFNDMKFNYVITNPPYGGDKNKKSDARIKREKIRKYINNKLTETDDEELIKAMKKQLKKLSETDLREQKDFDRSKVTVETSSMRVKEFAKKHGLTGKDKESVSLMLMMDMVDTDGTVIGVLKEGVVFDGKYKKLRECLVRNFNVKEIISIPRDQFENTQTKTSIVIFENTEQKTSKVKFREMIVDRYSDDIFELIGDEFVLTENKGDIREITDKIVAIATREKILANDTCSLNGKEYRTKKISIGEGYELGMIGNICDFLPKSKASASDGKDMGEYNFYTSSDKIQKCDKCDYDVLTIIVGNGGKSSLFLDKNFSCSDHNILIKSNQSDTMTKYIYISLSITFDDLISNMNGSTLENLSITALKNFYIPIPKSKEKVKEWVNKFFELRDKQIDNQIKIKNLETKIYEKITEIHSSSNYNTVNFDDICITKKGTPLTKEQYKTGKYPVIGAGITPSGWHNAYNMPKNTILCSASGKNAGYISRYPTKVWATDCFSITSRNTEITDDYVFYFLKSKQKTIFELNNGSSQPHVRACDLSKNIKIDIPKNKKILASLDPLFSEICTLLRDIAIANNEYKQLLRELKNEALPNEK